MAQQLPRGVGAPLGEQVVPRARSQVALHWASRNARLLAPLLTLICMVIFFSLVTDVFLTRQNLQNVVTQIAPIAVAATGVTFVLLCAEIDLSIASVATLTGVVSAWLYMGQVIDLGNWGIPVGILVAAGIGLLMRHRWAAWLSILIAVATVLVFAGFGLFVAEGGAYETRTAVAMSVRSAFWLLVAAVAIGQREGGTVGGRSLPK